MYSAHGYYYFAQIREIRENRRRIGGEKMADPYPRVLAAGPIPTFRKTFSRPICFFLIKLS